VTDLCEIIRFRASEIQSHGSLMLWHRLNRDRQSAELARLSRRFERAMLNRAVAAYLRTL
jgi:hypothetical protein